VEFFDHSSFAADVRNIIVGILNVYFWIIFARVLISWFSPDPYNPIVQFLRAVTDPAIEGLRRFVPRFLWSTGLDFTPLILILLLQIVISLLNNIRL
jgi:YggT family protein